MSAVTDGGADYQRLRFPYVPSPDRFSSPPARHPVIVVGAGPVGLTAAIDLAQHGIEVVLLDDDDRLSHGSRAICFAKRTLEIFDRLGCGERIAAKGVHWQIGKVFFRDRLIYSFDLLAESGHHRPAFVNIQQYYVEGYLLDRARELPTLDVRWKNKVTAVAQTPDGVSVGIETPDGEYALACDYLIAADGARSAVRNVLGLACAGQTFHDRFLIADVRMKADFPPERWFWFDPPFHGHQSALLHRQPDDVWRVDFQLGPEADPVLEKQPERVIPRVRALFGDETEFALEWVSVYAFSCARMERFRHGRILFAGDAAHTVSPFGARGANSGIQDAENLAWRLRLILQGKAPEPLLDSYDDERVAAADENIRASTRSTDFISPKSAISRTFRDAVLMLAEEHPFARTLVNSGRLSRPATLTESPLNTPDCDPFDGAMVPGAPAVDAPVLRTDGTECWFLEHLGDEFTGVYFADNVPSEEIVVALAALARAPIPIRPLIVVREVSHPVLTCGLPAVVDHHGLLHERYDAKPETYYLIRPDQHVCGRRRGVDATWAERALRRATTREAEAAILA